MNKTTRKKVKEVLKMKRCRYCRSTENLTIDHKIPISQGGTHAISNLQCLCKRCNGIKSGLSHKQVQQLMKWFLEIQESRIAHGAKPKMLKN